nr:hypothetical protein [Mycoplasmopsis bovis]
MKFGSLEAIYENIGKISGKTNEWLRKRLWIMLTFVKKLAILNPRCWDVDTDILYNLSKTSVQIRNESLQKKYMNWVYRLLY